MTLPVITVIDPQEKTVEIRPKEILHVIFTNRDDLSWNTNKPNQNDRDGIKLRPIRWETVYNDGFEPERKGIFQVLPFARRLGFCQCHYWFRVDPMDCLKVYMMKEEKRELCTVHFYGRDSTIGKLNVILSATEEDKKEFCDLTDDIIITGDFVAKEASYVGLGGRLIDEERGYIFNPAYKEQIIFDIRQRVMLIEIAEPPGLPNGLYKVVIPKTDTEVKNLSIKEMPTRIVNGKKIQRITVLNLLYSLPLGIEKMRLGLVKLHCLDPRYDKTLDFWITCNREVGSFFTDEDVETDEEINLEKQLNRSLSLILAEPTRASIWKSKVKIEEIKDDLTAGVKLFKVFPDRQQIEIINPKDNLNVSLAKGSKLIIKMYRDLDFRAPYYRTLDWEVNYRGDCLAMVRVFVDAHQQKFTFTRLENPNCWGETLFFKCENKQRNIHVHMVS